jgi:hypothetical protein
MQNSSSVQPFKLVLTACRKILDIAAESNFGMVREAATEHILHGSGSEERQRTMAKGPQPGGFLQKRPGDFVVPQSQIPADMLLRLASSAGLF